MVLLSIEKQFVKQTLLDISQTERAFDECKVKVHGGLRTFLEASILITQIIKDSYKQELRKILSQGITVDYFKFCQKYQKLQRELHCDVVKFMPTVSENEYPPEIVRPIEGIISDFEKDFTLILHPCDGSTFVITAIPDMVGNCIESLKPYVLKKYINKRNKFPKWFVILSFPRMLSRNPLLHTITLSHEILHLKDHIERISESTSNQIVIPKVKLDKLVEETFKRKIPIPGFELMLMPRTYSEFYSKDVLEQAVMEKCTDVIKSWIAEIVADLLAIRIMGPAYFFASAEHSLALGIMDRDSDSHPNTRMRLKIMMSELRSLGYLRGRKHNTEIIELLKKWNTYVKNKATIQQDPIHSVAAYTISKNLASLKINVRQRTNNIEYSSSKFHREVWELTNLINNGIPPCELMDFKNRESNYPSLAGILNAGYAAYLCGLDQLGSLIGQSGEKVEIESKQKLDELVLKAIEAADVWKSWPNT